jgi:hypothetical protein
MSVGELVFAFFNTPGIGGIAVFTIFGIAVAVYITLTRWILKGGQEKSRNQGFRFR